VRTYLRLAASVAGLLLLYAVLWPRYETTPEERQAVREGRTIIIYWDRHSGHEHEARRVLIDEFNRSQNKVYVRPLSVGYNASMEKLLTAVAGGCPPDICAMDGGIMMQLAAQGCFMPIEEKMARVPGLAKEDFLPHCWDAVSFNGHVWGIPTTTDSYCLLWNKNAFRKAGLDPDKPPTTMADLAEYAGRLTIYQDGGYKQVGFLPWQPWDNSTMFGLLFEGHWYDDKAGAACCANDPNLIRMYEWQRSFIKGMMPNGDAPYALYPERLLSFQGGFGAYMSTNNPFYSGKLAMIAEGEWQATFIPKYAPDLDWGVAPIPTADGCQPLAYGGPCVVDCIPRGCRNPEAAWEYMKWFYSPRADGGPSPASDYDYAIHNIPCLYRDAKQDRFYNDPKFRVFVDVLMTRKIVSLPITPLAQYFFDEIERQREKVVFGELTSRQALQQIQDKSNAAFEHTRRVMAGAGI
jgi:ABC-type glycerol-3-phosphate transport system substrate-binding protein